MLTIRNASIEDCPSLAKTQVDSYQNSYAGLLPPNYLSHFTYEEQEQDWIELLQSGTSDILLVAVSEENVLGYVLARAKRDIFPGYDAEIIALHVQKPSQKQGVGTALLSTIVKELIDLNCKSLMLWTLKGNPTRQWYEKLGGALLAEKSDQIDDWIVNEVAYGWENAKTLSAIL